jgi:hypothetical protein
VKLPTSIQQPFRVPLLTRTRIILSLAVAIAADSLQFVLGPLGWTLADQVIDAAAMVLTMWILGFHILLLPTFVVELAPVIEDLPTWTACVTAVIALRKRGQPAAPPQRPSDGNRIGLNQS